MGRYGSALVSLFIRKYLFSLGEPTDEQHLLEMLFDVARELKAALNEDQYPHIEDMTNLLIALSQLRWAFFYVPNSTSLCFCLFLFFFFVFFLHDLLMFFSFKKKCNEKKGKPKISSNFYRIHPHQQKDSQNLMIVLMQVV